MPKTCHYGRRLNRRRSRQGRDPGMETKPTLSCHPVWQIADRQVFDALDQKVGSPEVCIVGDCFLRANIVREGTRPPFSQAQSGHPSSRKELVEDHRPSPRNCTSFFVTRLSFRSSHSQTRSTLQPRCFSSRLTYRSRFRFRSSFSDQYFTFDVGRFLPPRQQCPCQKHPCTIMILLLLGKTKSGLPGRLLTCNLKRNPSRRTKRRTANSGVVSSPRTLRMHSLLRSGERVSIHGIVHPGLGSGSDSPA